MFICNIERAYFACREDCPVRQNTTATREDGIFASRNDSTTASVGEISSNEKFDGRKMTSEECRKFQAQRIMISSRIHDYIVVLVRDAIKLCWLREFFDVKLRLYSSRLTLRLPSQACELLGIEVRQQHLAALASKCDGSRPRER